jgi:hypothetical protein
MACELAPAVGGNLAVPRVQPDDDLARKGVAGVVQEAGALHRRGADDHVADAAVQVALDRLQGTYPASKLHRDLRADGLDDGLDHGRVLRLARDRSVEVHQVDALCSQVEPMPRHLLGFFGEDGLFPEVALLEADATPVLHIDRRYQQHGLVG